MKNVSYRDDFSFKLNNFASWFQIEKHLWLEVSLFTLIQSAVNLDNLQPARSKAKHSSSAVDTINIFNQVINSWEQLTLKKSELSSALSNKIINCCAHYANEMSKRIDELNWEPIDTGSQATKQWCLAVDNMVLVLESIEPILKKIEVNEQSVYFGQICPQECFNEVHNIIENAIKGFTQKLIACIKIHLIDDVVNCSLNEYFENTLEALFFTLRKDEYLRAIDAIQIEFSSMLDESIRTSLKKRYPVSFYIKIRCNLTMMMETFQKITKKTMQVENFINIDKMLELHGCDTLILIKRYCLECQSIESFGTLKIQFASAKNVLRISVQTVELPKRTDPDSMCNLFVRIRIYPKEKFQTFQRLRTKSVEGAQIADFKSSFVM